MLRHSIYSTTIDPLALSKSTAKRLKEILSERPNKISFIENVSYPYERTIFKGWRPISSFITFTHSLMKGVNINKLYYEVVGKKYFEDDYVIQYEVLGHLKLVSGQWKFKAKPTVGFRFKSVIDATCMHEKQNQWLCLVLLRLYYADEAGVSRYYLKGFNSYPSRYQDHADITFHMDFRYPLLARPSEHHQDQLRFEVIGKSLGVGSFAAVHYILLTMTPQTDGSFLKKITQRILKEEIFDAAKFDEWQGDYPIAKLTYHMHPKPPVFFVNKNLPRGFMVARYFEGVTLKVHLEKQGKQPANITAALTLILALIDGMDNQLHKHNIIHRDIKPKNVIIDDELEDFPTVNFIDVNLSKEERIVDPGVRCGTMLYASPEALKGESTTTAADVYALGLIVTEVLHVREKDEIYLPGVKGLTKRLEKIYTSSNQLTIPECAELARLIRSMINSRSELRPKLNEMFVAFNTIRVEKIIAANLNLPRYVFVQVHTAAAYAHRYIDSCFIQKTGEWQGINLTGLLKSQLTNFIDDPALIQEFIFTLRISAFYGLTTRDELYEKADSITRAYSEVLNDLFKVISKINTLLAGPLGESLDEDYLIYVMNEIHNAERRQSIFPRSMDHLMEITKSINTDCARLNIEFNYLSRECVWGVRSDTAVRPLMSRKKAESMFKIFTENVTMLDGKSISVGVTATDLCLPDKTYGSQSANMVKKT